MDVKERADGITSVLCYIKVTVCSHDHIRWQWVHAILSGRTDGAERAALHESGEHCTIDPSYPNRILIRPVFKRQVRLSGYELQYQSYWYGVVNPGPS